MARILVRGALALALLGLAAPQLMAQEAVLSQLYGSGVHQFFAGNMAGANRDLSAAINAGTKDPRAYYFRALAAMKSGDTWGAAADLQTAAALEGADIDFVTPVGKALERVQGSQRMTIERYRAGARAQAYDRQLKRDTLRYEQRRRAEADVLRNPALSPPPKPPAAQPKPGAAPAPDEDLFNDQPAKVDEAAEDAAAPKDEGDPFGDEKSDEDMPAEEPADDMAADEPAAEAPAEAPEPPVAEPPAAEPPQADPFEGDEKPAAEPPAAEKPPEKPAEEMPQ